LIGGTGMSAHSWFNNMWYERRRPPWGLVFISNVYGAAARLRRVMYARRLRLSTRLSRPVIVVGNLSVGGTGKTPLVCWLVGSLQQRGFKPGVVTRGYGGSSRQPRIIQAQDDAAVVGDEPVLIARRTQVPVAIGRNRPAAAQLLIDMGCDIIVSDDGLQHYAMARNCEIAVVDGERRFGNGYLLPAGPLREPLQRIRSVNAIVVNGGPVIGASDELRTAGALTMCLKARVAIAVTDGESRALNEFAGQAVHAIAAIGNPQRFFDLLQRSGIEVIAHPLPDHAPLRAADIFFADDLPVLMTEKDAVKCGKIAGLRHWYVPVDVVFDNDDSVTLLKTVTNTLENALRLGHYG
jgi:tetraacyldisaccharide 4'-kinase